MKKFPTVQTPALSSGSPTSSSFCLRQCCTSVHPVVQSIIPSVPPSYPRPCIPFPTLFSAISTFTLTFRLVWTLFQIIVERLRRLYLLLLKIIVIRCAKVVVERRRCPTPFVPLSTKLDICHFLSKELLSHTNFTQIIVTFINKTKPQYLINSLVEINSCSIEYRKLQFQYDQSSLLIP